MPREPQSSARGARSDALRPPMRTVGPSFRRDVRRPAQPRAGNQIEVADPRTFPPTIIGRPKSALALRPASGRRTTRGAQRSRRAPRPVVQATARETAARLERLRRTVDQARAAIVALTDRAAASCEAGSAAALKRVLTADDKRALPANRLDKAVGLAGGADDDRVDIHAGVERAQRAEKHARVGAIVGEIRLGRRNRCTHIRARRLLVGTLPEPEVR